MIKFHNNINFNNINFKITIHFLSMDFFSYTKKRMGKIKDYFWGFLGCGTMNIHNNKLIHDAYKKPREFALIYINV